MFVKQVRRKCKPFSFAMNVRKLLLFIVLFLLGSFSYFAQYTDVINSNKPGFSESPYSVGTGIYQFENIFFYKKTSVAPTFSIPESYGTDLLFRTGFLLEKLELNAQLTYAKDSIAFKNIFTSKYTGHGFSRATIGAKYLLYEQEYEDKTKEVRSWKRRNQFDNKRLIPSVAIYLGMNTDFLSEWHKKRSITPKVGLLLQQNISDDFNIITNIYYDYIGTDFSEISYIVTATQNFSGRWSAFIENQTVFQKYQNNINLGVGFAYLFNKNLQINTSARLLLEGNSKGYYAGLGISYRINRYEIYKEIEDAGPNLKDTPITRYNKRQNGFFQRIFGVFKKKRTRQNTTRTRTIEPKKKKSGVLGLFGKKKPKAKKKETEIEKLEREIKELEEEMKKEEKKKKKNGNN